VAICGYANPSARALLAWCRLRGRAAILMSESKVDDLSQRHFWKEWPKQLLVRQFEAALCGGRPHRAYLEKLGLDREQIFLGYDVVDNDHFQYGAQKARRQPEKFRPLPGLGSPKPFFLASARFIPRKNLAGLLEAYRLYRRQVEPLRAWRLVILGEGPERHRLENIILRSGIPDICLPGFRKIEELPAYYGLAGAFIHPALQEQWGLVVNEAMAAGLPVLVSDRCGCVPDLIDPGRTGLLFDPADIPELAQLMMRVSSDNFDRQAMGAAAQARIGRWGPEKFAEGLLAAIDGLDKVGVRRRKNTL
jgi:glycosyltransferase involved in cell wall biosynthesis